jgi:hypothetical protein
LFSSPDNIVFDAVSKIYWVGLTTKIAAPFALPIFFNQHPNVARLMAWLPDWFIQR